ncbi:MAG: hypothetical protein HC822_15790 [Oscillochloris sp.]|nr:hypothetical protein [Oscillochloris sp.]
MNARAGEMRLRYAYTFSPLKASDPTITVEVLSADDLAVRGVVRVCVEFADRDPFDQAGTIVTLGMSEAVYNAVTDQSGVVIIADVALRGMDNWQISVVPPAQHHQH